MSFGRVDLEGLIFFVCSISSGSYTLLPLTWDSLIPEKTDSVDTYHLRKNAARYACCLLFFPSFSFRRREGEMGEETKKLKKISVLVWVLLL